GSLAALASSRNPFTSWDNLGDFAIQVGSGSLAEDNFEAGLASALHNRVHLGSTGPSRAEGPALLPPVRHDSLRRGNCVFGYFQIHTAACTTARATPLNA